MYYIKELHAGERVSEIYLCKQKQSSLTKSGKHYESLLLQDKTGTIDAKIWDPESNGIEECEAFDYVSVTGDVINYQGALQLNVKRLRKASAGEYDPGEYLPKSRYGADEMYRELQDFAESVENPYLRRLLAGFFLEDGDFADRFKHHSAAKSVHHGFAGGLLEHTLAVTRLCDFLAGHYEILNRDLLLTAAMLHDIGKLDELSPLPANDYTDEGQLLGHIAIGMETVGMHIRDIDGFPQKLSNDVKHCILSHHGELEFGSPKKPALPEAVALNFADNLDAKLETLREIFEDVPQGNTDWQGYNKLFESNLRRSSL